MQLLRLEVRNWVHHRFRVCEFTRGLVAILGENGSGKSSLFGAIRWALTGENPNYGVKTDNISQYAKEGEPSYVSLEFEHNGHLAVITRHLLPEKEQSVLTIDGTEAARGDKSVTAGVEKLLGVDAKFISRFIIVSQTEIFSFIDDNQTETDKFFQRLFNTAKADKCQDAIGKAMAKVTIPEIVHTAGELLLQIDDVETQIAALDDKLADLPTLDSFLSAQKTEQAVIQQWQHNEKAADELGKLLVQEKELVSRLKDADDNCKQYDEDLAALADAANGHEAAYAAAKTALGHWESYKHVAKLKEKLQEQRAYVADLRAKSPEPAKPGTPTAEQLHRTGEDISRRIKEAQKFIDMFTADGVAECPTCHTPTAKLSTRLTEQQALLTKLREEAAANTIDWSTQSKVEQAYAQWLKKDEELRGQEKRLDESERDLTVVAPPATSEGELQQAVGDYEQFQQARQEILPLAQQHREYKAKLLGIAENIKTRKEQLHAELASRTVTSADAEQAQTRLDRLQQRFEARQEIEQNRNQLQFDARRLREQHTSAVTQEQTAVALRGWTHIAESAREALKAAPRIVAQRNLQRLEAAINELLQIFSVNFVVRAASEDSPAFIAEFFDGRRQVAQRLSIGQKTVLALAFRVAVNAMFAEDIGLLALDEPTAALDAPRIQALAPVLEKLRALSTSKGLQCLLVTHASNLSHLFESTIELEAPELRHATNR